MKTFKVILTMRAECESDARELLECDLGLGDHEGGSTDYTLERILESDE
jgi:hypothetical protein